MRALPMPKSPDPVNDAPAPQVYFGFGVPLSPAVRGLCGRGVRALAPTAWVLAVAVLSAQACDPNGAARGEPPTPEVGQAATSPLTCGSGGAPCRVMPLGDSITDGYNAPGGYRLELFRVTRQAGKHITFVGSQRNGPLTWNGALFPRSHEGHSGFTIDEAPQAGRRGIAPFAPGRVAEFAPDIVLLLIGTNDISVDLELERAPKRLGALMDRILTNRPGTVLVVGQLPPTQHELLNQRVLAYNSAIPALVAERAARGAQVVLADAYSAFVRDPDYRSVLLEDTLHPSAAGYERLGQVFYSVLAPYLR